LYNGKRLDLGRSSSAKINMSNTVPIIGKHLSICENFQITYPNKVEYVKENVDARKQRTAEL
ncbi:1114_t:CDS:1, partial [Gigaspora rosea]